MTVRLRWLGCVCFEIVLPSGKVLLVDPFIDYSVTAPITCQEVTGADYIALTHGHYDHITDVGSLVERFHSKVICSHQVAEPLAKLFNLKNADMVRVTAGDTVIANDLRVEVRKGEHINLGPVRRALSRQRSRQGNGRGQQPLAEQGKNAHQAVGVRSKLSEIRERIREVGLDGGEQLTFVFQTGDNLRIGIYCSGCYQHLSDEVRAICPNILCMQLGGNHPEQAAEIAALSGAEIVIPMHHDSGGLEATHRLAQEMSQHLASRSSARFLDVIHGKWYQIGVGVSPV
ncbi:MAG: MBL fold metallo-hydrolase [Dehalococcoidales bacterium]|nr:MAG: MBL fold metallo-hydrolase [Dehalococcoidales bacterium]